MSRVTYSKIEGSEHGASLEISISRYCLFFVVLYDKFNKTKKDNTVLNSYLSTIGVIVKRLKYFTVSFISPVFYVL